MYDLYLKPSNGSGAEERLVDSPSPRWRSLLAKLVAETMSPRSRGTAFALLYLGSGAALLPASLIAGALWSAVEPSTPLLAGAFSRRAAWLGVLAVRT